MSIEGRISVDATFHDKDGDESLNVLASSGAKEYTTGKVAIVSGVVGATPVVLACQPTAYRDASGSLVSFQYLQRAVIRVTGGAITFHRYQEFASSETASYNGTYVETGSVAAIDLDNFDLDPQAGGSPAVVAIGPTASYTILLYGQ